MEQRIHGVSYPMTSSKNILSQWIPFDSVYPLMFIHLKEDFAFGIRPSDDGAIKPHSSQLGPVRLHIKIIKRKRATLFVMPMTLRFMFKRGTNNQRKFSQVRITYVPFKWCNLFYNLHFEFPFDSPIGKRDGPVRCFEYRHLSIWTAGKDGVRRLETIDAIFRYLRKWPTYLFEKRICGRKVGRNSLQTWCMKDNWIKSYAPQVTATSVVSWLLLVQFFLPSVLPFFPLKYKGIGPADHPHSTLQPK